MTSDSTKRRARRKAYLLSKIGNSGREFAARNGFSYNPGLDPERFATWVRVAAPSLIEHMDPDAEITQHLHIAIEAVAFLDALTVPAPATLEVA